MAGGRSAVVLAGLFVVCATAVAAPPPSTIVVDAASGAVLSADRPTHPWRPASLTKLMTVYMVFEALDAGALRGEDALPVSVRAAAQPPTKLGLAAGTTIPAGDAVEALIVRSANDVAVVLAEALAGDEASFAELMSFRAHDLGMTGTRFANASGLPDPGNVTDARDMAILARAVLMHFPGRMETFGTLSVERNGQRLPSYNGFLTAYPGAEGLKTGFTCASGYNLVAAATRDGRRLIAVVLGAASRPARLTAVRGLMDRGFARDSRDGVGAELLDALASPDPVPAPPVVISPADCAPEREEEILLTGRSAPAARAGIGGWGLSLGVYTDRGAAQSAVGRARAHAAAGGGRTVLMERKAAGITRFTALVTNLTQQQAVEACRALRADKAYCITLGPEALKNARAVWW